MAKRYGKGPPPWCQYRKIAITDARGTYASAMSNTRLQGLLKELDNLKLKIQNELDKEQQLIYNMNPKHLIRHHMQYKIYKETCCTFQDNQEEYTNFTDNHRQHLPHFELPYYLVTLTFDRQMIDVKDESQQIFKMMECINKLNKYQYYSCLEKHMSGIIHAHILILFDYDKAYPILKTIKNMLTQDAKNDKAVNVKPIKKTQKDLNNSYNYIIDHKPDHPKWKSLQFNIDL